MKEPVHHIVALGDVHGPLYGAQRSMLQLYERWHQEQRFHIHFVTPNVGPLYDAFRDLGIDTTLVPVGRLLGSYNKRLLNLRPWDYPLLAREMLMFAWRLSRILIEKKAALLHCNNDRVGLMAFSGARWVRCPMVTHIRRDRGFGRLDSIIYKGTTEIVWVSERVRREFAERIGVDDPKGRVVYNARSLPDANKPSTRGELLEEFGFSQDTWIGLVLAGFDPCKDHETFVAAADLACAEEPRLRFLLAGADTLPDQGRIREIKALVSEAGLNDRVQFLGHREDVGRLLRGSDILISSSKQEALGGALIEAIGYGVPIVATDTGGTAEIAPDGHCSLLVERGDFKAMAKRIVALVRNKTKREEFSRNARARFADLFTVEQCCERTAAFFDEVIGACRRRR